MPRGKEDAMPDLTGQSFGRYHILEQLGEGGMATVYKAYDTRLERNVALKVLRTDQFIPAQLQMVLQRFEREAKSLGKLKHSNIVNVLDFGEQEGMPYLVMEYLPGGTLKQKLGHSIPWQEAIRTLLPVACGLAYAHQHNIIHRDVKPANVLMDQNDQPILTDFGIAKLLEGTDGHTLTGTGVGIGTPEYMAPEQGIGASTIDARADIYSLGIVLYEMVTGRKPYVADTPMAVVLKQMMDPLPRPSGFVTDLSEGVEHILLKALAKEPDDRYADMNALIAAMECVLTEKQKVEAPLTEAAVPSRRVKKKTASRAKPSPKVVMALVSILAVIMIVSLGAPRMMQLFSAAPEAEAASTKALAVFSTAPVTILPPTKTLEPPPSSTPTKTPRPTATHTPAPAWMTDFSDPVLAYIAGQPPDFEDDFEPTSNAWAIADWCAAWRMKYENGRMVVDECYMKYQGESFNDYVAEVTISWITGRGDIGMEFRDGLCRVRIKPDFGMEAFCEKVVGGEVKPTDLLLKEYNISSSRTVRLRVIAKGGRFAFFLDGKPMGYFEEEVMSTGRQLELMVEKQGSTGAFDDFKIWDISNLEIP
jgi:serine/threonine protein kinase